MYVSLPHFLNAEEKFIKGVDGLKPDQNKHDYIVSFEPVSDYYKETKITNFNVRFI